MKVYFIEVANLDDRVAREVNKRSVDDITEQWSLYPNPTSDQLTITFDQMIDSGAIMITDQLGRCVDEHAISKQTNYQFSVANYASGMHYVRVSIADKLVYIDKFIVQ